MKIVVINKIRYMIVSMDQASKIMENDIFELFDLDLIEEEAQKILNGWDLIKVKRSGGIVAIEVGFV